MKSPEKFVLEVACTFDSSLQEAFMIKLIKYHVRAKL